MLPPSKISKMDVAYFTLNTDIYLQTLHQNREDNNVKFTAEGTSNFTNLVTLEVLPSSHKSKEKCFHTKISSSKGLKMGYFVKQFTVLIRHYLHPDCQTVS
jgi:hypothetical protein